MRVLIIGSGGREHAFAHAMRQSDKLSALFVAPGNTGILELADSAPVDVADHGTRSRSFAPMSGLIWLLLARKPLWLMVWLIA